MNLKEIREKNKKSRSEIARELGVTVSAYSHYEQGIRRIGLEQILILSKIYSCTEREIIEAQLKSCQSFQEDNQLLPQNNHKFL